jgi:hypothetical protein
MESSAARLPQMNIYTVQIPKPCPFIGIFCMFMQKKPQAQQTAGLILRQRGSLTFLSVGDIKVEYKMGH